MDVDALGSYRPTLKSMQKKSMQSEMSQICLDAGDEGSVLEWYMANPGCVN